MPKKILIVTGLSGAGRTSALKILEDLGFEAIDNIPTSLLVNILEANIKTRMLKIVKDFNLFIYFLSSIKSELINSLLTFI